MLAGLKKFIPYKFKRTTKRFLNNCIESVRYFYVRKRLVENRCLHIVFVCKGNICRSAFAEYYFKQKFREKNLKVESCGIDVDQGDVSPAEAVQVAEKFAVNLRTHHSKGLDESEIGQADMILAMEYWHYGRLVKMYPEKAADIFLLREFTPWPAGLFCNIYDPYGLELREFESCFRLIKSALDRLERQICDNTRTAYVESI